MEADPGSVDLGDLLQKILAVFCESRLVTDKQTMSVANEAAMRLAWIVCQPPFAPKVGSRGRPRILTETVVAAIIAQQFREVTDLEPLVRRVFAACGLKGHAKAALRAASKPNLAQALQGVTRVHRVETAEEFFERLAHHEMALKAGMFAASFAAISAKYAQLAKRALRFSK